MILFSFYFIKVLLFQFISFKTHLIFDQKLINIQNNFQPINYSY